MPEFWFMYLIPVVAIVAAVLYSQMSRAQLAVAVATGQGPILFHNAFAKHFDLQDEEFIVAMESTMQVGPLCLWCVPAWAAYYWRNNGAVVTA